MQQPKEYYAFISYKREDEKWARWLQDKLEHYKFPTNLNGRTDLPKYIRPTFRDVTDLKPGLLAEEINNALHSSEWLIVVCSPRSAKSPWVCKEAQTFIDLGRADHIIPFVIEGTPFSNDPTTECYPEALLNLTDSQELLAANINELGRDAAAIKVVARMFNLRFDALWQRFEREKRKRRLWWIFTAVTMIVLSAGIALWMWRMNTSLEKQNRILTIETIKSGSNEVMTLLEKREFASALDRLEPIVTLWKEDFRMETPIFEQALRTVCRMMSPDAALKVYTRPLSIYQHVVDADNDYFYVEDNVEGQVLRYDFSTGELVDTIFPIHSWQKNVYIESVKKGKILYVIADTIDQECNQMYLCDTHEKKNYRFSKQHVAAQFLSEDYILTTIKDGGSYLFRMQKDGIHGIGNLHLPFTNGVFSIWGDTLVTTNGNRVLAWSISRKKMLYEINYDDDDVSNSFTQGSCTELCPRNKTFAFSHPLKGLLLMSADRDSVQTIDAERTSSDVSMNDDGTLIVAKDTGSDSLFIYTNGICIGTISIPQSGLPRFASGRDLLFLGDGQISYMIIGKAFKEHGLYAPDGYSFIDQLDDTLFLGNDTIANNYLRLSFDSPYSRKMYGFTSQGSYYALSVNKTFHLIDYKQQRQVFSVTHDKLSAYGSTLQVSEDERTCMLRTTDSIYLYGIDSSNKAQYPRYETASGETLSPDGRLIAMRYGTNMMICDTACWENPLLVIPDLQHRNAIICTFTADSKQLMISYSDGSIELWDLSKRTLAAPVTNIANKAFESIDISPDKQYGLGVERQTVIDNHSVYVWHIPTGQLVEHIDLGWAKLLHKKRHLPIPLHFKACFARNGPPAIIVNETTFSGLSRVYPFPSLEDLVKEIRKQSSEYPL